MRPRAFILYALLWTPLLASAQTIEPAVPTQQRGEALLTRARQLSDIRSPNAPAFRLKATFTIAATNLETVEGTYTEVWVSRTQWRQEIVVKDFRRIEVAGASRRWLLDNAKDFPSRAARIPAMMQILPPISTHFDFESIEEHTGQSPVTECAFATNGDENSKHGFCFDKKSGLLLDRTSPEFRPHNVVNDNCVFGIFRRFENFWYPREMACFEDRHHVLDLKVVDLSLEPHPDSTLFTPPPGAIELANCPSQLVNPVPTYTSEPAHPLGSSELHDVIVGLVVDTKGKAQNVEIVRSGGKPFDEAALNAARDWRFKPATCEGEPVPTKINIQLNFR